MSFAPLSPISARRFCGAAALVCSLVLPACGKDDKAKETARGNMALSDSKVASDNGTYSLTSGDTCRRNVDTGRVDITLSRGGAGQPAITLAIKDFSASPKAYDCKQAADNTASASELGGKFESCMVDAKVSSGAGASTLNGYSMHRDAVAIKPFTYAGACSIKVTTAVPTISGTVTCADMVQTFLEGSPRNPVDATVTADLSADFSCTFK